MIPKEQTYLIYIFSKQSEIDDSNIPNLSHVTNQISEIKLCENEVEDVLKVINPTKVSGGNTHIRSFYTRNLFNYVPPVFARSIHVCNFLD
jgi:hypothetical protein